MVTTYTWDLFKDPFFIGFDRALDTWSHAQTVSSATNYPPYNGFSKTDIDVSTADGKLTVKGELNTEDNDSKFIHRGIAARKFTREWALGEYMEVKAAELKDGMLKIDIVRILPEEKKPKTIKIK
jgi:molecular chaperone IbpA